MFKLQLIKRSMMKTQRIFLLVVVWTQLKLFTQTKTPLFGVVVFIALVRILHNGCCILEKVMK